MSAEVAERVRAGFGPADWAPYAAIGALLLAELVAILALNDGMLVYSLDDPYIHLALAENIARGHYGINFAEPSAPSSSILWPLLLVPFAGADFHDKWPLVINMASALASVGVLQAILRHAMPPRAMPFRWLPPLIVAAAAIAFNLVGLVFTGMEHSLQVLLALTVVLGLVIEAEERRVPWFLIVAVIAGPLVRYENLGLSLGAVVYLALRGRLALAVGLGLATLLPVAAFSSFLLGIGLGWLPSSVLLKTQLAPAGATLPETALALARAVVWSPGLYPRLVLLGTAALFVWRALRPTGDAAVRPLAAAGAVMVIAHLVGGKYGWFGRYEVYAMISAGALSLYLYRSAVSSWLRVQSAGAAGSAALAVALVLGLPTVRATALTPLAANNIYAQHYQMHRFAVDYAGGAPVAVNDLGWVTYRNDGYVLDLWGLGSVEAGVRRGANEPGWMDEMVTRHGAQLAMLYEEWFGEQIPSGWKHLGTLRLSRFRVTPAASEVAFYATDSAAAAEFAPRLAQFAATLPEGVVFELAATSD
jgi:hypothetical protein